VGIVLIKNQNKNYPAGDFRSPECIELLKEADIVVTNPPFSLWRKFLAQLMEYDKKFLMLGNQTAISFKEVFPFLKENKIWIGASCKSVSFKTSFSLEPKKFGNIRWFTNLKANYKVKPLDLSKKHYTPEKYPKYDNYDAINVDKVADIPCDYPGVMGVPITFMDKYCPEQFEIVGISGSHFICDLNQNKDYSSYVGYHQNGKMNGRTGSTFGNCPTIRKNDMIHDYYRNGNEIVQAVYTRIFIKNQNPEWSKYLYEK